MKLHGSRLAEALRHHSSASPARQVAETAPEAVAEDKDSINGVQQLSHEATTINQAFSQQVHYRVIFWLVLGRVH